MTISHSDYVAKCRRKYRRIDHGYDEALLLHLLGSELAAARKAAGISAQDLAHRARVPTKLIHALERGDAQWDSVLDQISQAYWPIRQTLADRNIPLADSPQTRLDPRVLSRLGAMRPNVQVPSA